MKINNEFTVGVPADEAWSVMLDLERIAPCLPGASIRESEGDEYQGTMKVKIGPITANYKGTAKFEETDEENRRVVLKATGRDARGQGTASATIVSTLHEEGDDTRVKVETDMRLTGRAAQFGRGIAQDVATKMLDRFAECLEREISGGGAAQEAAAASTSEEGGNGAGRQEEAPPVTSVGGTAGRVIESDDPTIMAGATVEGAIVSDGASEAAASTATTERPPRREPEEQEAFDLGAAGREAILKRAGPVLAGLGLLAILIWWIRR
jgi:carbon monoxide dehydrogenase subunit G